jgi:hypothetical protein
VAIAFARPFDCPETPSFAFQKPEASIDVQRRAIVPSVMVIREFAGIGADQQHAVPAHGFGQTFGPPNGVGGIELASGVHEFYNHSRALPFERQHDMVVVLPRGAMFDDVVEEFGNTKPRRE